nr:ATP-dependent RNA helicase [Andalucia godoyi]|eukprot:ANDGO_02588.mRNA.1 ATP-dependent RNA helicase SUB2
MASYGEDLADYNDLEDAGKLPIATAASGATTGSAAAPTASASHVGAFSSGFRDFFLRPELHRAIVDAGFEFPSEVQHQCIPKAVLGTDILCQAKSGMGKTAVFVLAILHQLDLSSLAEKGTQALVLVHTRELAYQINSEFERFRKHMPGVTSVVFYGGTPVKQNLAVLAKDKQQPTVVVGTPGRVMDLLSRKDGLKVDNVRFFVLDECDRLLDEVDMRNMVQQIYAKLPKTKQVMMLSATLSKETAETAKRFMHNPWTVLIDDQSNLTLHGLQQYYAKVEEAAKTQKLMDLLDELEFNQVVIFVKSIDRCKMLTKLLNSVTFPAVSIHSDLSQHERIKRYQEFKDFKHRIVVSTDLIARGIDVERVNIVFNFDMPNSDDTYLHRVGRAGRFGTKGLAISLVSSKEDEEVLMKVQARFEVQIQELPPNGKVDPASYMAI